MKKIPLAVILGLALIQPALADDSIIAIKSQSDLAAAMRCQKEGFVYMMRLNKTDVVLMKYPLVHPEDESRFPFRTCDSVIEAAKEFIRERKALR